VLLVYLIFTMLRLAIPRGARFVVAESRKGQRKLLISRRCQKLAEAAVGEVFVAPTRWGSKIDPIVDSGRTNFEKVAIVKPVKETGAEKCNRA
jgi:hypothetical protein